MCMVLSFYDWMLREGYDPNRVDDGILIDLENDYEDFCCNEGIEPIWQGGK